MGQHWTIYNATKKICVKSAVDDWEKDDYDIDNIIAIMSWSKDDIIYASNSCWEIICHYNCVEDNGGTYISSYHDLKYDTKYIYNNEFIVNKMYTIGESYKPANKILVIGNSYHDIIIKN
jgi:IMP cyclohydrolase